jgi:hypothetical protein
MERRRESIKKGMLPITINYIVKPIFFCFHEFKPAKSNTIPNNRGTVLVSLSHITGRVFQHRLEERTGKNTNTDSLIAFISFVVNTLILPDL